MLSDHALRIRHHSGTSGQGVPESFDHLCKQMKDYNMDADLKPHGSRILVDSKFVVNSEYVNPLA